MWLPCNIIGSARFPAQNMKRDESPDYLCVLLEAIHAGGGRLGLGTRLQSLSICQHVHYSCRGLIWVMCFVQRLQPLSSNLIALSWLSIQSCEWQGCLSNSKLKCSLQSDLTFPHSSDRCSESSEAIASWLPRLHALVIGPGLGRDPAIMNTVKSVIAVAKQQNKDIVIDAVRSSYSYTSCIPTHYDSWVTLKKRHLTEVYRRLGFFRPYALQR